MAVNSQVKGKITLVGLLREKYFLKGYSDFAKNRGWNKDYDSWHIGSQENYERGRQFAAATFVKIPVKIKTMYGKTVLNMQAKWALSDLVREGAIS